MKSPVITDVALIAACGLYCPACSKFRKAKCPGCFKNEKATWCKVRACCLEKHIDNCTSCKEFANPRDCALFNNFFSRAIEFVFGSDRAKSIIYIRENGADEYVKLMSERGCMSLSKKHTF